MRCERESLRSIRQKASSATSLLDALIVMLTLSCLPVRAADSASSPIAFAPAVNPTPVGPAGSEPAGPDLSSAQQVDAVVARLRADRLISGERTVNRLRWRADRSLPGGSNSAWLDGLFRWIAGLFDTAAAGGRVALIVTTVFAAAGIAIFVLRRWRRSVRPAAIKVETPVVQGLDTRPESLPEDVGAAARALWQGGQPRAALLLLYRGLLSRLEHVHRLPVPPSATEGECMTLLRQRAAAPVRVYGLGLILAWQRIAYAHVSPAESIFEELCAGFDVALVSRERQAA